MMIMTELVWKDTKSSDERIVNQAIRKESYCCTLYGFIICRNLGLQKDVELISGNDHSIAWTHQTD